MGAAAESQAAAGGGREPGHRFPPCSRRRRRGTTRARRPREASPGFTPGAAVSPRRPRAAGGARFCAPFGSGQTVGSSARLFNHINPLVLCRIDTVSMELPFAGARCSHTPSLHGAFHQRAWRFLARSPRPRRRPASPSASGTGAAPRRLGAQRHAPRRSILARPTSGGFRRGPASLPLLNGSGACTPGVSQR